MVDPILATTSNRSTQATIDHVMPRARGGLDCPSNMLAMCRRCNEAKASSLPTGCDIVMLVASCARRGMEPASMDAIPWEPPVPARRRTLRDVWTLGM
jgi:hypothetical protein